MFRSLLLCFVWTLYELTRTELIPPLVQAGRVHVCEANYFKPYGLHGSFHGKIRTCRIFESNPLVRSILSTPGGGDVLVVDGGMSMRTALMGDQIAKLAVENGWAGVIINGCIR